jgi:hypothetical protein
MPICLMENDLATTEQYRVPSGNENRRIMGPQFNDWNDDFNKLSHTCTIIMYEYQTKRLHVPHS